MRSRSVDGPQIDARIQSAVLQCRPEMLRNECAHLFSRPDTGGIVVVRGKFVLRIDMIDQNALRLIRADARLKGFFLGSL